MRLIFDEATKVGKTHNREQFAGELMIELPPHECAEFFETPNKYKLKNGKLEVNENRLAEEEQRLATLTASISRVRNIEAARETEGLHKYTIEQAQTWINNRIDGATTIAGIKTELKTILCKMVPYLLK